MQIYSMVYHFLRKRRIPHPNLNVTRNMNECLQSERMEKCWKSLSIQFEILKTINPMIIQFSINASLKTTAKKI